VQNKHKQNKGVSMDLMKANREWCHRKDDEKASSLQELHDKVSFYQTNGATTVMDVADLQIAPAEGNQLVVEGIQSHQATFTNWSFGQVCDYGNAPAWFLRDLPAEQASDILNPRLHRSGKRTQILLCANGGLQIRALNGPTYPRIWNGDITSRLIRLAEEKPEWQPAPAAYDGSRGLYFSDHDVFAFCVDNDRRIFETKNGGLSRGFFVWNSEVGAKKFGLMTFWYEFVCGNHIVWGAQNVTEVELIHRGQGLNERAFGEMEVFLKQYAESSATEDEAKIKKAMTLRIAETKDEVLDKLFGLKIASRQRLENAYVCAESHPDWYGEDPRCVWPMVNGLTELAQSIPFMDERVTLEKNAGKLLEMKF
jgi:hypothetical protein